jgi:hypothetical protein
VPEAWLELPASCSWGFSVSVRASSALTPSDAGSSGLPEEEEEAYCSEDIRIQEVFGIYSEETDSLKTTLARRSTKNRKSKEKERINRLSTQDLNCE